MLEGTEHVVLPLELKVYPREFPAQHGPILHDKGSKYSVYIEVVNEWINLNNPEAFHSKPRDDRVLLIICAAYNILTFYASKVHGTTEDISGFDRLQGW